MTKVKVWFEREYNKRVEEEESKKKKYSTALFKVEGIFKVELDKTKENKKIPYAISKIKFYELWKFFMSYDHIKQGMEFLPQPRYAVRKGQQWFRVTKIELID